MRLTSTIEASNRRIKHLEAQVAKLRRNSDSAPRAGSVSPGLVCYEERATAPSQLTRRPGKSLNSKALPQSVTGTHSARSSPEESSGKSTPTMNTVDKMIVWLGSNRVTD